MTAAPSGSWHEGCFVSGPLAMLVAPFGRGRAVGIGVVYGLGLYLVNFHLLTAVFPWFAVARGWASVIGHLAFGGVAGALYRAITPQAIRRPAAPEGSVR